MPGFSLKGSLDSAGGFVTDVKGKVSTVKKGVAKVKSVVSPRKPKRTTANVIRGRAFALTRQRMLKARKKAMQIARAAAMKRAAAARAAAAKKRKPKKVIKWTEPQFYSWYMKFLKRRGGLSTFLKMNTNGKLFKKIISYANQARRVRKLPVLRAAKLRAYAQLGPRVMTRDLTFWEKFIKLMKIEWPA